MSISASIGLWASLVFLAIQVVTCGVAAWRCRRREPFQAPANAPPVSLVRPLCGLESHSRETLEACFRIDYPRFELLFCVASSEDPVTGLVDEAMRSFPQVCARLLVGDDQISGNPKLNNMVKAWRAAQHDHIVFADSNLLVPPDYLARLVSTWRPGVGLVSAPPIASSIKGFWSELESAFLNTYEARWEYVVDSVGFGFAQGKTLFFRRSLFPGGLEKLAAEPAEDAASTKILRGVGLRIKLARPPFFQPLGQRNFADVWSRQIRWARLRRATFPLLFLPEVATGLVLPLLVTLLALSNSPWPAATAGLLAYVVVWYLAELALCWACGWPLSPRSVPALVLRDLLIPALWAQALAGRGYVWKGQAMQVSAKPAGPAARSLMRRFVPAHKAGRPESSLLSSRHARSRVISVMRRMRRADKQ